MTRLIDTGSSVGNGAGTVAFDMCRIVVGSVDFAEDPLREVAEVKSV